MSQQWSRRVLILLSLPLFVVLTGGSHPHTLCRGIVEENNWQIPVTPFQAGGVSKSKYNAVLDQFERKFKPVVSQMGKRLDLRRLWDDPTVNATATQSGNTYTINMFGGLARHHEMTADGLMMITCHELGHHLGGAPKYEGGWWSNDWASVEGQSDYYASLRCLRQVWTASENFAWYEGATIDSSAKDECERTWNTQTEEQLCMRTAMTGKAVASFFKSIRYESRSPRFDSPDATVVSRTDSSHPATQCRLDTYYQGALCVHDMNVALSKTNPKTGTCSGHYEVSNHGARPRCWFKP